VGLGKFILTYYRPLSLNSSIFRLCARSRQFLPSRRLLDGFNSELTNIVVRFDAYLLLTSFQCGIILLPIISTTKRHKMIVWGLRLAMIPVAIILFVVLIRNFYTSDPSKGMLINRAGLGRANRSTACSWCRYLSCIPTASNNHCKG
jgi:hypothetical protein